MISLDKKLCDKARESVSKNASREVLKLSALSFAGDLAHEFTRNRNNVAVAIGFLIAVLAAIYATSTMGNTIEDQTDGNEAEKGSTYDLILKLHEELATCNESHTHAINIIGGICENMMLDMNDCLSAAMTLSEDAT